MAVKHFINLIIVPCGILVIWEILAHSGLFSAFLLPPPERVFSRFILLSQSGELLRHVLASSARALGGFCIAACVALPLAYINCHSKTSETRLKLTLEALRFIPPLSLIPLLILWLGIGEASKLSIVILASFFPIYLNTHSGFEQIGKNYYELAQILELKPLENFEHIEFPGALPSIITGLRLGFGYSWRALVGAELIAASSGLGYLIGDASEMSQTDKVFVGIISIAVLGILGDQLFQWFAKKLFVWQKS